MLSGFPYWKSHLLPWIRKIRGPSDRDHCFPVNISLYSIWPGRNKGWDFLKPSNNPSAVRKLYICEANIACFHRALETKVVSEGHLCSKKKYLRCIMCSREHRCYFSGIHYKSAIGENEGYMEALPHLFRTQIKDIWIRANPCCTLRKHSNPLCPQVCDITCSFWGDMQIAMTWVGPNNILILWPVCENPI